MKKRSIVFGIITAILIVISFALALMLGRYHISIRDFIGATFTDSYEYKTARSIIINLRLPRTIMSLLSGIALSLSGLIYQELFQNKLVSPDLLGVSGGSGVGAALAIVLGLSSVSISLFTFVFGVGTVLLTMLVAKLFRNKSSVMLLLAGIIVGGFMQAILSLIKYFANPETQLSDITYWLMGSFSDVTMKQVWIMFVVVAFCTCYLLLIRWRINVIALGREEAQSKGVPYVLYRTILIGIATLLTATSVAFCGTISWIGLVIPHIVRVITGKNTTRSIPGTILFGGFFMIVVDILSRTFTSAEIPLSAVTGLLGTIIFVGILIYNRRSFYEYEN